MTVRDRRFGPDSSSPEEDLGRQLPTVIRALGGDADIALTAVERTIRQLRRGASIHSPVGYAIRVGENLRAASAELRELVAAPDTLELLAARDDPSQDAIELAPGWVDRILAAQLAAGATPIQAAAAGIGAVLQLDPDRVATAEGIVTGFLALVVAAEDTIDPPPGREHPADRRRHRDRQRRRLHRSLPDSLDVLLAAIGPVAPALSIDGVRVRQEEAMGTRAEERRRDRERKRGPRHGGATEHLTRTTGDLSS